MRERELIVYVFYDRIQNFIHEYEAPERFKKSLALMLACIISHETGHVLMPGTGHQSGTIMQRTWQGRDLYNLGIHGAHFSAKQAEIILKNARRLR